MTEGTDTFYCIKCGRRHRRDSMVGGHHHAGLDVEREGFDPEVAAVGVALRRAIDDSRGSEATLADVQEKFGELGLDEQFGASAPEDVLSDLRERHMIGDSRHSGRHWYYFLANKRTPRREDRSPESFSIWMKKYADALERANVR